jgi:dolichyl-phosphate beta-glucosyltransferase
MSSVIVVIPCYNEAKRLSVLQFKAFSLRSCSIRFLFVNDGSTDETINLLECLRKYDPQCFMVCNLPENVGKAEAVRQGLLQAFNAKPDYVGYWDADLATPLNAIPVFYDLLYEMRLNIVHKYALLRESCERSFRRAGHAQNPTGHC